MADLTLRLGRGVVDVLETSTRREWLLTDGQGGYAMGTVAGARTRAYHGLLVAATESGLRRVLVVGGIAEEVTTAPQRTVRLHAQRWQDGSVDPRGFELIESFQLDATFAVWQYAVDGCLLEKRLFMPRSVAATTVVVYTLLRAPAGTAVRLTLRPLCTWRDHHAPGRAGDAPQVAVGGSAMTVRFAHGGPLHVRATSGDIAGGGDWYFGFGLEAETERGLAAVDDLYAAGVITADIGPGNSVAVSLSLDPSVHPAAWRVLADAERQRASGLIERAGHVDAPAAIRRLTLAADQFVVARGGGAAVIAGYPWFSDWGRDTFIALPGLALLTGRFDLSAGLLRAYAGWVRDGLLPNVFPDSGQAPEYNSVDATLWYVEALRAHVAATGDQTLVDELWPVLEEIVARHLDGTRHGIGVDPGDGLLRSGQAGVQLTWMDAKAGDWVVTPRIGKPVEVNALWHNALRAIAGWAPTRVGCGDCAALAEQVGVSFQRFWNQARGYCFDAIDGPDGDDPAIRPNAVIAAALANTPLSAAQVTSVVAVAERELVTSLGLRSLAGGETGYVGQYRGGVVDRDGAYHQGTVWPWLMGPFVSAHLRAHGDAQRARAFLSPLLDHLVDAGLGSVSEIADGDPPHTPRGCPWQAWSVAELLRAWRLTAASPGP